MYGFSAYSEYAYSEIPVAVVAATVAAVDQSGGWVPDPLTARRLIARHLDETGEKRGVKPPIVFVEPLVDDTFPRELAAAVAAADAAYMAWQDGLLEEAAMQARARRIERDEEDALLLMMDS